jgi:hypothetical protein
MSGVGDLGLITPVRLFVVEGPARLGTLVGGIYSEEDSSSLLHAGLGYRLADWDLVT